MKRPYSTFAHPGSGLDKLLGDLEREVMEIMWARGDASVRDVFDALNAARPRGRHLAYTTVMTVMARLAEKRLLGRRLVGKAHAYAVAETREAFLARASQNLARQMVEDFGEAAIASFLTVLESVPPDRLARLRRRVQPRGDT